MMTQIDTCVITSEIDVREAILELEQKTDCKLVTAHDRSGTAAVHFQI